MGEVAVASAAEERVGEELERNRQKKINERMEFEQQTEFFN
jgi:hypothetical protein